MPPVAFGSSSPGGRPRPFGAEPLRPFLPFLPLPGRPPPGPPMPIFFIIFCISPNCLTSRLTSPTSVPEPLAMRWRRLPLMITGVARSSGVIERMIASIGLRSSSSILAPLSSLGMPGHHPHQVAERAHLLDLLHLFEEVVEGELPLHQLRGGLFGLVGFEGLFGLLDQGEHVAHAEDASRHPVGVELLELGELLAGGGEGDRAADDLLDRQRGTAAGVAVHLRHDHAVDLERLVERLGGLDGVLTGHGIDDEEGVVGLDRSGDLADLLHHLGVDRQTTGGVDDDDVAAEALRLLEAGRRCPHRIGRVGEDGHVDLATERAQLFDGGRTLEVGADEQRLAALALEPRRQLRRVGGLARALEAGHQHHRGRLGGVGDRERLAAEGPGQLVVDRLDDLLGGIEGARAGCTDR